VQENEKGEHGEELPDWFTPVAQDVLRYCRPVEGVWVDLGSGSGGLGLALAGMSHGAVVLIDPDGAALAKGLRNARRSGLAGRVFGVVGRAESIPLRDGSVDLVTSRGSVFFWHDPPQGLREVRRVLRPGGWGMIGGGFGSSYPQWAFKEFFRRIYKAVNAQGKEAVRKWNEPRRPEWLTAQARAAGVETVAGKPVPPGMWLIFRKPADSGCLKIRARITGRSADLASRAGSSAAEP